MGEFNRSMKDFENIVFLKNWKLQYIIRLDDGIMRFFNLPIWSSLLKCLPIVKNLEFNVFCTYLGFKKDEIVFEGVIPSNRKDIWVADKHEDIIGNVWLRKK